MMMAIAEWISPFWRRYRRIALRGIAFCLNALILLGIFGLIVLAVVAYPPRANAPRPHSAGNAALTPAHSRPGSFGPVIECILSGEGDANKRFIDFESGKRFAAAEFFGLDEEPSPTQTHQWSRETGIDAMGEASSMIRIDSAGAKRLASPAGICEHWRANAGNESCRTVSGGDGVSAGGSAAALGVGHVVG